MSLLLSQMVVLSGIISIVKLTSHFKNPTLYLSLFASTAINLPLFN